MKIFIKIPIGIENLLFPAQKIQWDCFGVPFFSIYFQWGWNHRAIPIGVEILGNIFHWGQFLGQYLSSGTENPPGLWHRGVFELSGRYMPMNPVLTIIHCDISMMRMQRNRNKFLKIQMFKNRVLFWAMIKTVCPTSICRLLSRCFSKMFTRLLLGY